MMYLGKHTVHLPDIISETTLLIHRQCGMTVVLPVTYKLRALAVYS